MGSECELSSGFKLVPWSSWDQWDFVRESLFSPSPDLVSRALQRISAWRSRGFIPVPVDVTAAIVEIQQKDPFFREGSITNALNSEELLSMLYCMAIMRLVNCFVEPAHKKTGRSISQLADAVGIPRMLVDIRHESSHRNLPSIRLVRMASIKALDWLKSNYWEPQRNAIPDVRKEVRSRLRELSICLKNKHTQKSSSSQGNGKRCKQSGVLFRSNKLSSQIAGKLRTSKSDVPDKRITKITKIISGLYTSYPSEVVAVLLEFFHLQATDFSDGTDMECSDDSNIDDSGIHVDALCDIKTIITKLSSKKPGLILGILKMVLKMIEVKESAQFEKGGCDYLSSTCQKEVADMTRLCSLVHWLLMRLKSLKDSGRIEVIDESPQFSPGGNANPNVTLKKLLIKILSLSVVSDGHLSSSVFLLARMIGNISLSARLKKIPLLVTQDQDFAEGFSFSNTESMLLKEEALLKQATDILESMKSQLRKQGGRNSSNGQTDAATNRKWTVAKSWTPCPIGMLPCSFSSTAVLPVLDNADDDDAVGKNTVETDNDGTVERNTLETNAAYATEKREADHNIDENETVCKRLRATGEDQVSDFPEASSPMEGRLLIGGIWKKVTEEELLDIESNIRIFAKSPPVQN